MSNVKIYRYHIVTPNNDRLESNIPEYDQAVTIQSFLQEKLKRDDLQIIKEHVPQLHGHRLGRDPDLH